MSDQRVRNAVERIRGAGVRETNRGLPLRTESRVGPPAIWNLDVLAAALGFAVPPDVVSWWNSCGETWLEREVNYGQWGIVLFAPAPALATTVEYRALYPDDVVPTDLVFGECRGDSQIVIVFGDARSADYGRVMVATLPDHRADWPIVSDFHIRLHRVVSFFARREILGTTAPVTALRV